MDARTDAEISRDVAQVAGALLLELRDGYGPIDDKDAANALRKLADRTSHERIMELLSAARPDDAILSEETEDSFHRLEANRVWIIDPLDGTHNYSRAFPWFGISIALQHNGHLLAGVGQRQAAAPVVLAQRSRARRRTRRRWFGSTSRAKS